MAHLDVSKLGAKEILAIRYGWPKVECHVCGRSATGLYKLQNVRTGKTIFRQMCAECAFTRTGSPKISVSPVFEITGPPTERVYSEDAPLPHTDEGGLFIATKYQTPEAGEVLLGSLYAESTTAAVEQAHHRWSLSEGWHLRVFRAPAPTPEEPSSEISHNG